MNRTNGSTVRSPGPEAVQERGSDGQHRLAVHRRPGQRRQGRPGQDRAHQPGVHGGGGEDRSEPACGETLAVRWVRTRRSSVQGGELIHFCLFVSV